MRSKYLVATSVAALAMFATAQVTSAQADPTAPPPPVKKHHHHHHDDAMMAADTSTSASNPKEAADAQKMDELEQRLDALESEVQSSEQREATEQTQMAGYADKMTGWWDDTKISGRMYYDITDINNAHQVHGSTVSNKDGDDGVSFDIKRFYVGIDHNFNSWLTADVTTDVIFNTGTKATATSLPSATGYQLDLYVKYAYIQATYDDALNVRIGSAAMPWIPYDDDIYGYRFVEKTIVDRTSFGNSADWGVHVYGKFWGGLVDYQVSAVNGGGFKNPTRTQQPDVEARIGFHWDGLQAAIGGYNGVEGFEKCGNNVLPLTNCPTTTAFPALHHHYTRLDALVAYTWEGLKVGGEYFYAQNHGNEGGGTSSTTGNSNAYGWEAFSSYQVTPEWSVFGRYDYVHPKSDGTIAAHLFHNNYFNVGVDYSPQKWVDFALVYKNDEGTDGNFSDANGTIGGAGAATTIPYTHDNGTYSEVGLFGQVRW